MVLLIAFLVDSVSELDALDDELLAAISQLFVFILKSLADLKEIETFLFPDRGHGRIVALEHLQFQLHLLHFLNDLLGFDLFLDQFALVEADLFLFAVLS